MDFSESRAIYLQITDMICENILTGEWAAGDRIPSVRDLAVDIQVNPNTVQRAYTWLQDRDVIRTQRGVGYFITDEGYDITLQLKKEEFISATCPRIARAMQLLQLDFADLKAILEKQEDDS